MHSLRLPDQTTQVQTGIQIHLATNPATLPLMGIRSTGFYLVAIIDWATRRVLSWRLSNTLTAGFCVEALSEALARFGSYARKLVTG